MSGLSIGLVHELITQSLAAWHVAGIVQVTSDRAIVIGAKPEIRIEPAPAGSMFRWTITIDRRTRPAISVLAVLRQVRGALDPGYAASRVHVAVSPVVASSWIQS
jgi:hypothetical protein